MDFIEAILNLIFPPKCGICHKIGEGYICQECLCELEKNIYINTNKNIFYLFNYRDIIRNKIIDFKINIRFPFPSISQISIIYIYHKKLISDNQVSS